MNDKVLMELENACFRLCNRERVARRVEPLLNEQRLSFYNRGHALYCCNAGYSNHDFFSERVLEFAEVTMIPEYGITGHSPGSTDFYLPVSVGENVAMVEYSEGVASFLATAENISAGFAMTLVSPFVTAWINSPGHFAGLIDRNWNVSGLGIAYIPESRLACAVQIFFTI